MTNKVLTKISFNAIPKTVTAMESAAEREGMSRTDVLNRAMQTYDMIMRAVLEEGKVLILERRDGSQDRVTFL